MVKTTDVAQLALDLGKASFDNIFDSVTTLQASLEDRMSGLVRQTCWSPVAAVVDECIGLLRRTRGDFKATTDRCFVILSIQDRSTPVTPAARGPVQQAASRPRADGHQAVRVN